MATDEKRHASLKDRERCSTPTMDNSASATRGIQRECEIVNQHLESSMTESRTATTPLFDPPRINARVRLISCMHARASRCAHKVKGGSLELSLNCMHGHAQVRLLVVNVDSNTWGSIEEICVKWK